MLALGVLLGLVFRRSRDLARPLMPATIFLIVLGTLLRIDGRAVSPRCGGRRFRSVAGNRHGGLPVAGGAAGRASGLSSGTRAGDRARRLGAAIERKRGGGTHARARSGAVPLVVTVLSMVLAPVTVPLLGRLARRLEISAFELALRLALLTGGAEAVAGSCSAGMRRRPRARRGGRWDHYRSLLVFAVATMAGIRAQIAADVPARNALRCPCLRLQHRPQVAGAVLLPGNLRRAPDGRAHSRQSQCRPGLVGARCCRLATMALYFAATQFPIYILPRLIETLIGRDTRKAKP